ncbi:CAP domain-containing protein [Bacillus sp. EB600]|uniref:CAP domain-containing protein n=1 Tax=Bacillus sp. EB600 TaxID=2806345 RepID=UPI0021097D37|nr:CAP domain-containing protein [Bacillus sp. EB600]
MIIGFYINVSHQDGNEVLIKKNFTKQSNDTIPRKLKGQLGRPATEKPKEGLSLLIGQDVGNLEKELGKPQRIDQTIYGYQWYIYNLNFKRYVQVGVEDNHVVAIYASGEDLNIAPFEIGQPVEEIFNTQYIDTNVDITIGSNTYRFELNDTDINLRPLIQLGDIYVQLYFDKYSGELSGVRFLNAETLVKERGYELVYHGELIEPPIPDEILWESAESGTEKEIFDITNVLRKRNGLRPLKWDEKTAEAAFKHSKDMFETSDFSHTSSRYGGLSDRLKAANVGYQSAGENIAANYTDGPAVVEGWLNSQSHRESLLNKNFTHLGVGVYQKYYTQDFIQIIK